MLRDGVENETSKKEYAFSEGNVLPLVDFLVQELENKVKGLVGRKKEARFSPLMYQIAYDEYAMSEAGYREKKKSHP